MSRELVSFVEMHPVRCPVCAEADERLIEPGAVDALRTRYALAVSAVFRLCSNTAS